MWRAEGWGLGAEPEECQDLGAIAYSSKKPLDIGGEADLGVFLHFFLGCIMGHLELNLWLFLPMSPAWC